MDGYLEKQEHNDQEQNTEPLEEGQYDKDNEDMADLLIYNTPRTRIWQTTKDEHVVK